jgi:hypothetical protein
MTDKQSTHPAGFPLPVLRGYALQRAAFVPALLLETTQRRREPRPSR